MSLHEFERRLERLVEGVFAKAFRSRLTPLEVGRRLTRQMDLNRTVGVRGVIAPNHFTVAVSPADNQHFSSFATALAADLAGYAREHAQKEGYRFMGPVQVELEEAANLGPGQFMVAGEMREAPGGGPVGALVLAGGARVQIGEEPLVIGRNPGTDVVLHDTTVSKRHAEVRREGNGFVLVDLGSLNGTRVNGHGVKERRLEDGDEITVGPVVLRFETS